MKNLLWYKTCAKNWEEALPLGNGFMGAMCFAGPIMDRFQLNADSLWYGGFKDRVNPDAKEALPMIRRLLAEGKISKAEKLANEALCAIPDSQCHYETLGDVFFILDGSQSLPLLGMKDGWNPNLYEMKQARNYQRSLDLMKGLHQVTYMLEDCKVEREAFISYPDEVMMIRSLGSETSVTYERGAYFGSFQKADENTLLFLGQAGPKGVAYVLGMRAIKGGLGITGKTLHLSQDAVLCLCSATSFYTEDPKKYVMERLEAASQKGYETLKQRHIQDVKSLMERCELSLLGETDEMKAMATDERLRRVQNREEDVGLVNLLFQFGRYLLVSSSRPGCLPANLQGIWNKDFLPMWDSKYTININAQMNYWPSEVTNLSELSEPLFSHMKRMWPNGKAVARKMYGARGWMAHHNTDIWGDCAPQDVHPPATYWQMGAAWLCLHLLEHYRFTKDKSFLISYLDLIKDAALFFEDTLKEDENGYLVVTPSVSPENTYRLPNGETGNLCEGASMDAQILRELFGGLLEISQEISQEWEEDTSLFTCEELALYQTIYEKLLPISIHENGTIMEWSKPYEEVEVGHRHISHLFALYPGNGIKTGGQRAACEKTLRRRLSHGGGHTGWSRAWIINLWARLENGEEAYQNILGLMRTSMLENLFDNHPPFQIDGNFGLVSGIAEMLVQSQDEEIVLLPALPKAFSNGSVKGLCLRGKLQVDLWWEDGKLTKASFLSPMNQKIRVRGIGELRLKQNVIYHIQS